MHRFRVIEHKLIRIFEKKQFSGIFIRINKKICHLNTSMFAFLRKSQNYTLRFEAREHLAEAN